MQPFIVEINRSYHEQHYSWYNQTLLPSTDGISESLESIVATPPLSQQQKSVDQHGPKRPRTVEPHTLISKTTQQKFHKCTIEQQ